MNLTFLGHACFLLDDGNCRVLTDPYLSENPLAPVKPDEVETDYICVTHGHGDHIGDTVQIARRTGARICCPVELGSAVFAPQGLETIPANLGGTCKLPFGSVKLVPALHGSGIPGCLSCGFLFEMGGKKIYHAGDTALISDMALLAEEDIDVALLPIGDVYTMGPKDTLRAVKMIRPKLVIPMHYNTFPLIVQDPNAFAEAVTASGFQAAVLEPGQPLSL